MFISQSGYIFFFITQCLEETQEGRKTLLKDKVKLWRALK